MPLPTNLKNDLRQILRDFRAANGLMAIPDGPGKALEAWVLMRLSRAARRTGKWHVTLRTPDGSQMLPGVPFVFPASQSGILPSTAIGPCHVLLTHSDHPQRRLELHGGLQWRGRSGATHEMDVSAIPAIISQSLRTSGGGVPRGLPILAIECKDKQTTGTPDEMRQTLARLFDLALVTKPPGGLTCRTYEDVANVHWGRWRPTYRSSFRMGMFAIARVGNFSAGATQLAEHYFIHRIDRVFDAHQLSMRRLEALFRGTLSILDLM